METPIAVQIGLSACVVGAFLVFAALVTRFTLFVFGDRRVPPFRELRAMDPFGASLAFWANFLKPGLVIIALGAGLTIAAAAASWVVTQF